MIEFQDHRVLLDKFSKEKAFIITDANVYKYYYKSIKQFNHCILQPGEHSKNITSVGIITKKLSDLNIDKNGILIGFGGGVITDITGFCASIYKRGIQHYFLPTSLLAMLDACLGGKTAINHNGIKNLIGTFNEPTKIIIDKKFLSTLPHKHLKNGIAEAIKKSLIGNFELLDHFLLENNDIDFIIKSSLDFKKKIVEKDKYDQGLRQILNFGHTFGHSIESAYNLLHGEAVAQGIYIETALSSKLNDTDKNTIFNLLEKFDFKYNSNIKFDDLIVGLLNDKKNNNGLKIVLLESIGMPYIEKLKIKDLESKLHDLRFDRN